MSESDSVGRSGDSFFRRPPVRWLGGVLLVVGLSGLVLTGALRSVFDADRLENRLDKAVHQATRGRYELKMDAVEWDVLTRSLRFERIILAPDSQADSEATGDMRPWRRVDASIPTLRLQGISLWALLWDGTLQLDAVRVDRPRLQIRPAESPNERARSTSDAPRDSSSGIGWLSGVTTQTLRVEEGTLVRGPSAQPARDSVWGLSLQVGRLSLDSLRHGEARAYLLRRFSTGQFDGVRRRISEGPYTLHLGPGQLSRRDSTLTVEDLRFAPTVPDSTFVDRHEYRINRVRAQADRVQSSGVDIHRLVEDGTICSDLLRIDNLDVDVYRDNQSPPRPEDPPPPMPQDLVNELDRSVRIDTLRVRNSQIRYTKRPENISQTGAIWFDDLWASLYNVTTDPRRMTPATPMVVETRTRVNGAGRLRATFRIPLLAPDLDLSFTGWLGPMDARAFNETFVPLGGVRVESGQVDSLWFQADVIQGTASGSLHGHYRNLEVETLDEASGDRGLGNRLKTVVTGLALRSRNVPTEKNPEIGKIQHTRAPEDTFFKFLWHAVRDGIYSLVGIDRLPR